MVSLIILKAGSPAVTTALFAIHIDASSGCAMRTEYSEYFNVFVCSGVSPLLTSCHSPPLLVDVTVTSASVTVLATVKSYVQSASAAFTSLTSGLQP